MIAGTPPAPYRAALRLDQLGKKRTRKKKVSELARPALTPEFLQTDDGRDHVEALYYRCSIHGTYGEIEDFMPWTVRKELPEEGAWIRVNIVPNTEMVVPPFSQWFATNDFMDVDKFGLQIRRVRISTPDGPLWLLPHEYCRVDDIAQWLGREDEGIFMRMMAGEATRVDPEALLYLRSRGIGKADALLMLLGQIKSPNFCWFEIAPPQYGEQFGKEWPSPERCPFCTPRENFIADNLK